MFCEKENSMHKIVTLLLLGIIFIAQDVRADDGFGEMFYNQTPKGMADHTVSEEETSDIAMDDAAQDMRDIMPAAGEEEADDSAVKASEKMDNEE